MISIICYINHSLNPNAVYTSNGIKTIKKINIGDEITINYYITYKKSHNLL
jgi:hypothetical protein